MNRAPQRPRYDEYRRPAQRPPQKQNSFATTLAVLMVAVVVVVAVIVVISVVRRSGDGEQTTPVTSSTDVLSTEEKDNNIAPTTQAALSVTKDNTYHILIDPGHGFDDNGCTSDYMSGKYEKDITLAVAGYLGQDLENMGFRISFTHDGETYTDEQTLLSQLNSLGLDYTDDKVIDNNIFSAYERTMYANILNCSDPVDAFISLHVNSNVDSGTLSDFTVDYCGENSSTAYSGELVDSVLSSLKTAFPSREQRRYSDSWEDSYIVTKYSNMPSFLIEMGYATTPSDAENLKDSSWQQQLAKALADGIDAYFASVN
jgi:N-acetylmuramoyl-L-alanine amidase